MGSIDFVLSIGFITFALPFSFAPFYTARILYGFNVYLFCVCKDVLVDVLFFCSNKKGRHFSRPDTETLDCKNLY